MSETAKPTRVHKRKVKLVVNPPAVLKKIYDRERVRRKRPADANAVRTKPNKRSAYQKINYSTYIHKVFLRYAPPRSRVSKSFVSAMDALLKHTFSRIAHTASDLAHFNKESTLTESHVQTATRMELNPQIAFHALEVGKQVAEKYKLHAKKKQEEVHVE